MITWGQLAKSQTDPEKIEEAIQRLINEHNADPEAHLVEGGSLKSHKMAEIIDHLVEVLLLIKFDWRWYPQNPGSPVQLFNQAIARAIKRGVIVRAIANTPPDC
jgi:hypothetical protein